MLSRRDKLFIRPWQQRRYENHLRKVQSALPAIDNRPPVSRKHVAVKLKRKQTEDERCMQIEKDNLILLQKLTHIMHTNRVNNSWTTPPPNFLNRVGIYAASSKERLTAETPPVTTKQTTRVRTANCLACTPQKAPKPLIPEARVPWEPEKPPVRKIRSKSVPAKRTEVLATIQETSISSPVTPPPKVREKPTEEWRNSGRANRKKESSTKNDKPPQSIILSRGSLVLAVNFPSDTFVKFQDGMSEKLIVRGLCQCKNTAKKIY